MALVLAERDYKLLVLFTKVAGIFLFAAGTITVVDRGEALLGLGLVASGILVALAPVPMSVVRPRDVDEAESGDRLEVRE